MTPTTANCDSQYVYEVASTRSSDFSTKFWIPGSISAWMRFSASMTSVPFQNASAMPRSAAPRATW